MIGYGILNEHRRIYPKFYHRKRQEGVGASRETQSAQQLSGQLLSE
jgi:hypothetical protein